MDGYLEKRQMLADVAVGQLGNDRASDYWPHVLPSSWQGPYPPHWCGAFALWCVNTALQTGLLWGFGRLSGFLFRLEQLPRHVYPQSGDIGYRHHLQHHAVVVNVDSRGVHTVDGNSGYPPKVVEGYHDIRDHGWHHFSVRRLLAASDGRYR